MENNILDKVNESFKGVNDKLSNLKTTIIDDKLEQLQISSSLPKIIEKLNNLLHINFFGLGTTGSLLGISVFDMQKKLNTSKTGKILNTILKKYGGIEGLHKTYITKTLTTCFTDEPQKREVISSLYTLYATEKTQHISSDIISDVDSFNHVCNLGLQETTPDNIKNKLPPISYSYFSQTVYNHIEDKKGLLDPSVLQTLGCVVPTKIGPNNILIIDTTSKDWNPTSITPTIIDAYIQQTTKEFISTPSFMENIPSADHFVLALMGGLFVQGNTFAQAILLGTHTLKDFETSSIPLQNKEQSLLSSPTILDMENAKITQEMDKYTDCPLSVDMVVTSAKKYTIPISYIMSIMKNDSGYGTTGVAVKTHNPGNVGNMDDNSTKDRGTWEKGVDVVAENLKKRVDAYHKLFGTQQYPTLEELTSGKHATTGEKFFGVYMTAQHGPSVVQGYQDQLIKDNSQIV